jgi:hypothetical protein
MYRAVVLFLDSCDIRTQVSRIYRELINVPIASAICHAISGKKIYKKRPFFRIYNRTLHLQSNLKILARSKMLRHLIKINRVLFTKYSLLVQRRMFTIPCKALKASIKGKIKSMALSIKKKSAIALLLPAEDMDIIKGSVSVAHEILLLEDGTTRKFYNFTFLKHDLPA